MKMGAREKCRVEDVHWKSQIIVWIALGLILEGTIVVAAPDSDWVLGTKQDLVSQTSQIHLVKTVPSATDSALRLQIDLTCKVPGTINASVIAADMELIWRQQFTPIRWRVGKLVKNEREFEGDFNNVANIDDFFSPSTSSQWSGTLAIEVITDHGPLAVEMSLDTPNAQSFAKRCEIDPEKITADAEKKAAAKKASDQRAQDKKMAENVFMAAFKEKWEQCIDISMSGRPFHYGRTNTGELERLNNFWINDILPGNLTSADRANGVEWKGSVVAEFYTYQTLNPNNSILSPANDKAWFPDSGLQHPKGCGNIQGDVFKKNGQWNAVVHEWRPTCPVDPLPCPSHSR